MHIITGFLKNINYQFCTTNIVLYWRGVGYLFLLIYFLYYVHFLEKHISQISIILILVISNTLNILFINTLALIYVNKRFLV